VAYRLCAGKRSLTFSIRNTFSQNVVYALIPE